MNDTETCPGHCGYCDEKHRDWEAQLAAKDAQLELLKALALRWNRAASGAGICGSEYVDDPERVFAAVRCTREALRKAAIRRQATPGVAAKDAVIRDLKNALSVARDYIREHGSEHGWPKGVEADARLVEAALALAADAAKEGLK